MKTQLIEFLNTKGYKVNKKPYDIIKTCDSWYANELIDGFHNRRNVQGTTYEIERTNMAKRCCEDDANLCEVIEINASGENNEEQSAFINGVLKDNRFNVMFREQLERTSGTGAAGAYIYLDGAEEYSDGSLRDGEIKINYVEAGQIAPLTVVNDEVVECAFSGTNIHKGELRYTLVLFVLGKDSKYQFTSYTFDKTFKLINESEPIQLGTIKPFSVMKNAGVNNISDMYGFGVPKIWNATTFLKGCDLAWHVYLSDMGKADKLVMINEQLCKFDASGKPIKPSREAKELFVLLGEKLPSEDSIIHEHTPELRTDAIIKAMEFSLSMLSNMFGFGTRRYSFENGQIKTATEYIGERQDSMQELNKQRQNVIDYITELVHAIIWFGNTYNGVTYDESVEVLVDFDDSFITDKKSELENMRNDATVLMLPAIVINYLKKAYGLTDDEAKAWYEGGGTVAEE